MSTFRVRRFEITGQGADNDIEHEIEIRGDDDYAHGYLDGFLEALYPAQLWAHEIASMEVQGNVLVYEVHVWHR